MLTMPITRPPQTRSRMLGLFLGYSSTFFREKYTGPDGVSDHRKIVNDSAAGLKTVLRTVITRPLDSNRTISDLSWSTTSSRCRALKNTRSASSQASGSSSPQRSRRGPIRAIASSRSISPFETNQGKYAWRRGHGGRPISSRGSINRTSTGPHDSPGCRSGIPISAPVSDSRAGTTHSYPSPRAGSEDRNISQGSHGNCPFLSCSRIYSNTFRTSASDWARNSSSFTDL